MDYESDRSLPKYAVIEQDFAAKIESGELPGGSELPSESDLMALYQVSRVTVRRAIDELYHHGYIEKMQGKRTRVKGHVPLQELSSAYSYTEEIIRHGMTPSRRIISSELRICTPAESELLLLPKADPVFHMDRIYYADGLPLCFTQTTLPYRIFQDIESCDFKEQSLYHVLETHYGITITSTSLKLKAVSSPGNVAKYLEVSDNTPLLHSTGLTYGNCHGEEIPIEIFTSYYLTTRFEYTLVQKRG
ncbi:MAG: GntR family transcriptional regulator [Lachnospiraceae bacterium]|nr:GntR family transcriptional regulator [Lachnospiraceae bacterium]